jgi:endoglucanase
MYARRVPLVVLALLLLIVPVASAAPPDAIRTGGPSSPADSKIAIVGSSGSLAGRRFTVVDAKGKRILSGTLTKAKGSPLPWKSASAADLSAVKTPGTYRVKAGNLTSRPWIVADGVRAAMIRRLLKFYAAQRDGSEPNPVFGPAHLTDAIVGEGPYAGQHFDLTGGWRDAGDHIKFGQQAAMSVIYLTVAARLAPEVAPELLAEARVGVRWLVKLHPRPDLFLVQVGDDRDHAEGFRDPALDDARADDGIGRRFAWPSPGSNTAGRIAGALATAAAALPEAERPALIQAAREWYALGKATNAPTKVRGDFYQSKDFLDDLALGAAGLWRATGETGFLADAAGFVRDAEMDGGVDSFAEGPIAAAELCGSLGAPAAPDAGARDAGCEGVRTAVSAAKDKAGVSAFGTPGNITWSGTADAGGSGALAAVGGGKAGRRMAAGGRDWLVGRNPWAASFLVGRGPGEARNPHHPVFLKGTPSRLLDGAVVGGPATPEDISEQKLPKPRGAFARFNSSLAVYEDSRANYVTSEVTIGSQASVVLLAASLGK